MANNKPPHGMSQQMYLSTARQHMLHARYAEAVANSLVGLGSDAISDPVSWADAVPSLPRRAGQQHVVELHSHLCCIAVQGVCRLGCSDAAAEIVSRVFGDAREMARAGDATTVPVSVTLSLAHGLVSAERYKEAEGWLLAGIDVFNSKAKLGAQAQMRSERRSDSAILVEFLLFRVLCAKGTTGPAAAASFLESSRCPKLPRAVVKEFASKIKKLSADKQTDKKCTAIEKKGQLNSDSSQNTRAQFQQQTHAAPTGHVDVTSAEKPTSHISGQVPHPAADNTVAIPFRFFWWLVSMRGCSTVGMFALLAFLVRPKGRVGAWLKDQISAMASVALSVRY